jgi:23S rRNA pseudouridine1911/1915/1917 synthase
MLLLDRLVRRFPSARRHTLKRMVQDGRVRVNGRVARRLKEAVNDADEIRVHPTCRAEPIPRTSSPHLVIVYEDQDLLVVNKPPGLLTSTVPREPRPTLLANVRDFVAAKDPRARVGLIHRLDRDASGLLVFSKNNQAYESLKKQLFHRTVHRVYTAIVEGKPPQAKGRIRTRLIELADGSVRSTKTQGKGVAALTEYVVLAQAGNRAMLRVVLHTGRKHQIRAHLSERGMPIVNDLVYDKPGQRKGRLMLAATSLSFAHPRTGRRVRFEIPIPQELKRAMASEGTPSPA